MLSPKIIETFNTCTIDCNVHCIKISRNTIMRIFAFAKRKFNQYVKSIKTKFTIYIIILYIYKVMFHFTAVIRFLNLAWKKTSAVYFESENNEE